MRLVSKYLSILLVLAFTASAVNELKPINEAKTSSGFIERTWNTIKDNWFTITISSASAVLLAKRIAAVVGSRKNTAPEKQDGDGAIAPAGEKQNQGEKIDSANAGVQAETETSPVQAAAAEPIASTPETAAPSAAVSPISEASGTQPPSPSNPSVELSAQGDTAGIGTVD